MAGDLPDGRPLGTGKSPDGQQELMLLRLKPLRMSSRLAEMKKAADLQPKIGECSIIRIRQFAV